MKTNFNPTKLREARGSRSASSVAELLNITRQHLWQIETGRKKPGTELLTRLCWLYDLDISDVSNGRTNEKRKAA